MLTSGGSVRVVAYASPADMRKGFDTLCGLVRDLGRDPLSGDLYLFVSRDRLRAKVLHWDGTGACLYSKRLEQGRFACLWRPDQRGKLELSTAELSLFLEGCQEVGRRVLSPPRIDPNRLLLTGTK